MQAIQTYFVPPSNTRGSRIVAKAARRIILSWDHALNPEENHAAAAAEYARRMGWPMERFTFANGGLADGSIVHILVSK